MSPLTAGPLCCHRDPPRKTHITDWDYPVHAPLTTYNPIALPLCIPAAICVFVCVLVFDVVKFNVIYLLCYFFFQFVLFSLFDDMFNLPFSFQFANVFDVISVSFFIFCKICKCF